MLCILVVYNIDELWNIKKCMKELISELNAIECSLLLVSTAIIITIILGLIMSGFNRD